jgi:glycosyltransferase involved in cell wall biosynthesis
VEKPGRENRNLIDSSLIKPATGVIHKNGYHKPGLLDFSLIVPAYEEESILGNNLKMFTKELRAGYNFELIVSDGGSTDSTIEIAEIYADKIVLHEGSHRQTIAEGRNRGADAANSETLVFLNADSIPADLENFINTCLKFSKKDGEYANIDALACYVEGLPEEVKLKDKIFYKLHNSYVNMLNLVGMGMGRGECQVVRRDVFLKAGKYNDKIVAGEDFDLYRRIARIGKIKFDKNIHILESPRRFRKYGYLKTVWYWTLNSLTVMLLNKSYSKEWEAVR